MKQFSLLAALSLLAVATSFPQEAEFFHPELEWNTIETEHFYVHYHDGTERTAKTVAKIAEEVFEPVTTLYDHRPDQKVSFIIRDHDDISNGAAYFYDNKIEIYAPNLDFELRGTHNWLRNVVTHEFTHIIQIQTAMKFGRRVPSFYFQWLGYESERRPDVLYGYPNVIVSYPISGFVVPVWFAEGTAQFNRKDLRYDFWDSHRDMILRSYALDRKLLTWEQMAVFGKTSLGNESSYNAGFAFVSYIAHHYGEEALNEISRNLARTAEVSIDGAIERAVGKSGRELFEEWQRKLELEYEARVSPVRAHLQEGAPLVVEEEGHEHNVGEPPRIQTLGEPRDRVTASGAWQLPCCRFNLMTGFANLYPAFSPDGKKLAYSSTKGADYFGQSSLFVYDLERKEEQRVQFGVRSPVAWSPDGKKIFYGRATRDHPHWSYQNDLYVYDLERKEETRVTYGRRAISPAISPDGATLVFVVNHDGITNLACSSVDGKEYRQLTSFTSGDQVYNPSWSPSGDRILFDYSLKDGRDLAEIRPDGSDLRFIISGPEDERTGVYSRDGSKIVFASDRTGIFNLYSYDLRTGAVEQISNVLGGAFMPTVNASGDIVYAAYTSDGYKLYTMHSPPVMPAGDFSYIPSASPGDPPCCGAPAVASHSTPALQVSWDQLRSYDDTTPPSFESRPYRSMFSSLMLVPFLRIDNYNPKNRAADVFKPGVYLFSNELLDKTGFFAGAALNRKLERDLFLQFNYRGQIPLLYQLGLEPVASLELYNVTRKTDNVISLPASTIPVDVTYNLFEFDVVLRQALISQFSNVEFRYAHSRYTSVIEAFINSETNPPTLVSGTSDLYLIANDLSLTFRVDAIVPSRTSEINPVGRKIALRVGREYNKFNGDGEYEITPTGLSPVYKNFTFTRVELSWKEYFPLWFKHHTLAASFRGGSILGPPVDEFFDFYAGGLIGMKGYPFYALGGNEMAVAGLAYRFPLVQNIDARFLQLYFDKLYASVFVDMGNAWTGSGPSLKEFKTDAGIELRLESFSFYSYPTRFFCNAAYGFSAFDRLVRSSNQLVSYGKEWRFYFGVLFGFDLD